MLHRIAYSAFLLLPLLAAAQAPVYQPFEVDSAATPRGGVSVLETYLRVNTRKPVMAQVANVAGKVVVNAVVEPDGRVSSLSILRSLRPDCDREAIRVMRLFNAWKPAQKGGIAVRQAISYPVSFAPNAPLRHEAGHFLTFYNADRQVVSDPAEAKHVLMVPLDTLTNVPTGDLRLCKVSKGQVGREISRFPLVRNQIEPQQPGDQPATQVGHKQPDGDWIGTVYTLRTDGTLLSTEPADRAAGQVIHYARNGIVDQQENLETHQLMSWFANGQLRQIQTWEPADARAMTLGSHRVSTEWDSLGRLLVRQGNGYVVRQQFIASPKNLGQQTLLTEEGGYRDGQPDGVWKGQTADGSYRFEERYEQGKCLGGTATSNGQTITYDEADKKPEFEGGVRSMYSFLAQTIQYPADAQRGGIMGRVFVSFTVCTDGSLCDFSVIRGVHPSLDQEALRVVKQMNKRWKPGAQRGKPVRVKYNLPISFMLG